MKPLPYPLLFFLLLFSLFSFTTSTARLQLTVINDNKNAISLQAGDWQLRVEPGKTISIDEQLNDLSVPYTVSVSIIGMTVQSHALNVELRILDGSYTGRKLQLEKDGRFIFESIPDEMEWYQFTGKITPSNVYPLAAALVSQQPGSAASTDILASYICRAKFSPDSIESLYTRLTTAQQSSPRGKIVAAYIDGRRALMPGKIMADFQLPDSSGKMVSLYSIKSRYILIDCWFSTCKPCIEGFPELIDLCNKTSRDDLTIIGISVDAPAMLPSWKTAIRKYNLPWINLSDPEYSIPYYRYGIEQYPTKVLVDREYKIVGVNWEVSEINKLLSEK